MAGQRDRASRSLPVPALVVVAYLYLVCGFATVVAITRQDLLASDAALWLIVVSTSAAAAAATVAAYRS